MGRHSFKPAWWLPNPHLQTLWPAILRQDIKDLQIERERVDLPDGDFIDLDWIDRGNTSAPLILILHGLEGSIDSHYAKGLLKMIREQGWRGVFMHFRGCSGEPNRLPRCYHSGETEDLGYISSLLLERTPHTPMFAVGVSLGGNVLLKWLGETGEKNPLQGAVAISVPFELYKSFQRVQQGFSKFYHWYLLRCICKSISRKFKQMKPPFDLPDLDTVDNMYEFDDKITAPLHGFSGVDEYYAIASSRNYLHKIQIPTLIIHAKDDPLVSETSIPESHELSDKIKFELSDTGGHVGFVSGKYPWTAEYWLEKRISDFLRELI